MTKRTKKEKKEARHPFLISWEKAENSSQAGVVKGHLKNEAKSSQNKIVKTKNANNMVKELSLDQIKHDMVRSLILASLILALEIVIYLVWRKPGP